jgi:hypothetical protein
MGYMVDQAPEQSREIAELINLQGIYGMSNADAFTTYLTSVGSVEFLNAFDQFAEKNTEEVGTFIGSAIADNTIINAEWLGNHNIASSSLSDAVSKIADRTEASMFFQDWLTPRNPKWLTDNTSLDERLNIVFLNDQTTFMTGYLNELGVGNINRALEHIPQMTTALYLNFVWEAVLHNTLNPTYRPPQVNTPDAGNIENDTIYLAEHHLYGSSRLGIKTYDKTRYRSVYQRPVGSTTPGTITENTLATQVPWYSGGFADWIQKDKTVLYTGTVYNLSLDSFRNVRTLGAKQYELTDHLGNVLATVLDKKTGYGNVGGLYKGYWANLASVTDYYPGGFEMPGRNKTFANYRFGNQNQESDDEIYGSGNVSIFKYRFEDTRLNRFFSVDPLSAKYPHNSPYAFGENRLTDGIELEGLEWAGVHLSYGHKADPEKTRKTLLFASSAKDAFVGDIKALGRWQTWYHMGDIFMVDDGSDSKSSQEFIDRTQSTVDYIRSVPNWGPGEWGRLTGHIAFNVALTKTGGIVAKGFGAVFEMPKLRTLSTLEARKWYLAQEAKIKSVVANEPILEMRAKKAFELRNVIRTFARELMEDRKVAEGLYKTDPNWTWDAIYKKYNGDYNTIIQKSTESRASVNEALGVKPPAQQ